MVGIAIETQTHFMADSYIQMSDEFYKSLPKEEGWSKPIYKYKRYWYPGNYLPSVISFQQQFQAEDTDIFVVTIPKSGTVWLKALTYAIVNRARYTPSSNSHPLLTTNAHSLVPFMEAQLYLHNKNPDLSKLESPRLFGTHIPYSSLPESIKDSKCRIVYLCRNPKDVIVSFWYFLQKFGAKVEFDQAFELFCKGALPFGPYWEHVLEFWKLSLELPQKVLFLKYEDMKEDSNLHLKKMAEFLGYPFSSQEVDEGVVDDILKLCSFQNMSTLEVNKSGRADFDGKFANDIFFRKGKVGDWRDHLTQEMVEKLEEITKEKLDGSGLML
ncbi:Sulfotransferase [Thalictrum thalictroides]|uniref:Sulfotransferase n=1 Tax=Thalictrum thalictroides TaxID=46969 RepID=A0A7J6X6G8_THATH|nr:Sulfotransferase [Thalictrum thalictroides]